MYLSGFSCGVSMPQMYGRLFLVWTLFKTLAVILVSDCFHVFLTVIKFELGLLHRCGSPRRWNGNHTLAR